MKKYLAIVILSFFLNLTNSISQVGIYPQAVFLDMQNRASNIKVINTSDQSKEIIIDIKFGYPEYDSLGEYKLIYGDTLPEAKWSAVPFVKVFPKKLLLKGKEEQVVKFMLGNMNNNPDGTYFGRVFVLSKNPPEEIDTNYTDKISAKIDVQFTLVSALIVEKGKVDCKINIIGNKATVDTAKVNILTLLEKSGNSPFLGTTEVKIYDNSANLVAETKEMTPIYFTSKKAFKFDKNLFQNGKYRVEIIMTNEHKDVPKEFKIPFEPAKASFMVDIEGT
jgi:hypothetical protein